MLQEISFEFEGCHKQGMKYDFENFRVNEANRIKPIQTILKKQKKKQFDM